LRVKIWTTACPRRSAGVSPSSGPKTPTPVHLVDLGVDGRADDGAVLGVHLPVEHEPPVEGLRQRHRHPRRRLDDRLVRVDRADVEPGGLLPGPQEPPGVDDPQVGHLVDQVRLLLGHEVGQLRRPDLDQQIDLGPPQPSRPERSSHDRHGPQGSSEVHISAAASPGLVDPGGQPPRSGPSRIGSVEHPPVEHVGGGDQRPLHPSLQRMQRQQLLDDLTVGQTIQVHVDTGEIHRQKCSEQVYASQRQTQVNQGFERRGARQTTVDQPDETGRSTPHQPSVRPTRPATRSEGPRSRERR
jgi:hypothetical protein